MSTLHLPSRFRLCSLSLLIAMHTPLASAQSITLTGENATISQGCRITENPANCSTEVLTPIDPADSNPTGPWVLSTDIAIGTNVNDPSQTLTQGTLSVINGAKVDSSYVHLGYEKNTEGELIIAGSGSSWTNNAGVVVGKQGNGTLRILDGGQHRQVSDDVDNAIYLGYDTETEGRIIVDGVSENGDRSTLSSQPFMIVGNYGHGELQVLNGALVSAASPGAYLITSNQVGSSSSIVVDGVDTATGFRSTLTAGEKILELAIKGAGSLTVSNGGLAKAEFANLGFSAGSTAIVNVDGVHAITKDRSALEADYLVVGYEGQVELNVTNGAKLKSSEYTFLSADPLGKGVLNVDGSNQVTGDRSELDIKSLYVSGAGYGEFNVTNGAHAEITEDFQIGGIKLNNFDDPEDLKKGKGVVNIIGKNSSVTASNKTVIVGGQGEGILTLADGGTLNTKQVGLGLFGNAVAKLNIGTGGAAGILNANTVATRDGDAEVNFNHTDNLIFSPRLIGTLRLNHINNGQTTLAAPSTYSGNTNLAAGTLVAGGTNYLSPLSTILIGQAGSLRFAGYSQDLKQIENAGVIEFGENAGTAITLSGDYVGNGGIIRLNTELGDDSSITDKLIVKGDTSGSSKITVRNTVGLGAPTVEGIEIINVAGASNGNFDLLGDYSINGKAAIVAGAYAYQLQQGSRSGANTESWYLRSDLDPTPEPEPEPTPNPTPSPDPSPDPTPTPEPSPDNRPKGTDPLYQAGVPLYEAYPSFLLNLSELPTWRQRVGNQNGRFLSGSAMTRETQLNNSSPIWVRMEGQHSKISPRTSTSNTNYDYDSLKLQLGFEHAIWSGAPGQLTGGLNAQYIRAKAYVHSLHGEGSIKTTGYGIGATLTWLGKNNVYLDNQAQLLWYDSDLQSKTAAKTLDDGNKGHGYALSTELGKRMVIDDKWSFIPQAQLMYSNAKTKAFTDSFQSNVSKGKASSFTLRIGTSLDYQNSGVDSSGKAYNHNLYSTLSLHQDFSSRANISVENTSFTQKPERLWASLGLGGAYSWKNDKVAIYGELGVKSSIKHFGDSYGYQGMIGIRTRW